MCKVNMSQADTCEECAVKCMLIHKTKRDPSSVVRSFFKVMVDDRFFEFLPVPPRFAPRLASLVDQEIRVEDSSGRKWTITLSTVKGRLAFDGGWHVFSSDHGIELGDIVIVNYILDSHFVVQIYGRSGCEKLNLPSEKNTNKNKRIRKTTDSVGKDGLCSRSEADPSKLNLPSEKNTNKSKRIRKTNLVGKDELCSRSEADPSKLNVPSEKNTNKNKRIGKTTDSVGRDGLCSRSEADPSKLTLPSEKNTNKDKRTRETTDSVGRDGHCSRSEADLEGRALKKNKNESHQISVSREGYLDEPRLMTVNRDMPFVGEEEQITLFDVFVSEISNSKFVGNVENVQKGSGSYEAEDMTDQIAVADLLKETCDAKIDRTNGNGNYEATTIKDGHKNNKGTRQENGDMEINMVHSESAANLKVPEQQYNGGLKDKDVMDYDSAFEDLLRDPLDVNLSEFEEGNREFEWTSETDHTSKAVITAVNSNFANNSTEFMNGQVKDCSVSLPLSDLNVNEHNIIKTNISAKPRAEISTTECQIDGNTGTSIPEKHAPAIGGSHSTNIPSDQEVPHSVAAIKKVQSIDRSVKIAKNKQKEFKSEQVGSKLKPRITGLPHKTLNARTSVGKVDKIVKADPVDQAPLEVSCFVTPDSESSLELPKGFPSGCLKSKEKLVLLRDPQGRLWPVRYLEEDDDFKALVYGWKSIKIANGIQCGDECIFSLEDQLDCIYRLKIIHKSVIGDCI